MRNLFLIIILIFPTFCLAEEKEEKEEKKVIEGQFVLLELFTSQSCASCPPADTLLTRITDQALKQKKPIYSLSYHVDYWNHLGWKDPYSTASATQRQQDYAKALDTDGAYTPQMIINGSQAIVGSDSKALGAAIKSVESNKPAILKIDWVKRFKSVKYSIRGSKPDSNLFIVGYKPFHRNQVLRGDNAGKTLTHSNVVKFMTSFPVQSRGWGKKELRVPEAVKSDEMKLIAFLQRQDTLEIYAATPIENYPPEEEAEKKK